MIKYYEVLESTTNLYSQWIPANSANEAIKLAHTKKYIEKWDEHGEQIESTRVEDKPITKEEYLKIKCNGHWYTSEEDLAIHGDCPYHDLKFLLMKKKLERT